MTQFTKMTHISDQKWKEKFQLTTFIQFFSNFSLIIFVDLFIFK